MELGGQCLLTVGCSAGYFTDVCADFQSKMPVISAASHCAGEVYRLQIVVNNNDCVETSRLLGVYSNLDPRVRPLVIALRYWAKVGHSLCFNVCAIFSHQKQILIVDLFRHCSDFM